MTAISASDLRQATVAVLKEWCKDLGCKPQGTKEEIIKQLRAHMAKQSKADKPKEKEAEVKQPLDNRQGKHCDGSGTTGTLRNCTSGGLQRKELPSAAAKGVMQRAAEESQSSSISHCDLGRKRLQCQTEISEKHTEAARPKRRKSANGTETSQCLRTEADTAEVCMNSESATEDSSACTGLSASLRNASEPATTAADTTLEDQNLKRVATPMKKPPLRLAGLKSRWHALSPLPTAPAALSPLVGGVEQWAAKQDKDLFKNAARLLGADALVAARSPLPSSAKVLAATSPSVVDLTSACAVSHDVLDLTDACSDVGGEDQCSPASKAREAMVARSIAAAVRDEMAQEPRLVDLSTGMVHTLPYDGMVSVGNSGDCELAVVRPAVADRHCILLCTGGCVEVEDLDSEGTFINDIRVPKGVLLPQRVELSHEDTLTLGRLEGPKFLFLAGCRRSAANAGA